MSFAEIDINNINQVNYIKKRWLYSFLIFYSFSLFSLLKFVITTEMFSYYMVAGWLFPIALYFDAYRRSGLVLLMIFMGIVPVFYVTSVIGNLLLFLPVPDFPFSYVVSIGVVLYGWLLYNSYLLMKLNCVINAKNYDLVVKTLWVFSFFIYTGLQVINKTFAPVEYKVSLLANGSVLFFIYSIIAFPTYYFVMYKRSTIAIVLFLLFIPPKVYLNLEQSHTFVSYRVLWFVVLTFFIVSSYRLYRVNHEWVCKSRKRRSDSN